MTQNKTELISLGLLNFTNCTPINYTFNKWGHDHVSLSCGYPTLLNYLMDDNQLHVSPVSSLYYIENPDKFKLIETISISSYGEVGSVILFSKYKLSELEGKTVGLPFTSHTSIALLKILLKSKGVDLNSINFVIHKYELELDEQLQNAFDAVLYIGDPAFIASTKNKCKYSEYDLGLEWNNLTGLPMVFSVWLARADWVLVNKNDFDWISFMLNKSVEAGLNLYFNEVLNEASQILKIHESFIADYLKNKLNYSFTAEHVESLGLFKKFYNQLK